MSSPDWSRMAWHIWRGAAVTLAWLRSGSCFLPRSLEVRADLVPLIGSRSLLYELSGVRRLRWLAGRVVGGDWDLRSTPAPDHPAYESFDQRFRQGADWEATSYWREVVADVRRRVPRIGCRSLEDVERKFRGFDHLWKLVGTPSYWPLGDPARLQPWEAVLVGVARNGDLVLVDGRHRLIMAHLKRCELPVLIILRHTGAEAGSDWRLGCGRSGTVGTSRSDRALTQPQPPAIGDSEDRGT